jgi:hypothetical protein
VWFRVKRRLSKFYECFVDVGVTSKLTHKHHIFFIILYLFFHVNYFYREIKKKKLELTDQKFQVAIR